METNKVKKIDALNGMKKLDKSSVDVIVTSPPYNIGKNYNQHDDNLDFEEYLEWMEEFGQEAKRVLKENGSLFFNIGDKPSDDFRSFQVAQRVSNSLELQNTIHWVKSIAIPEENVNLGHYKPVNSPRYLNNVHEYIFHFSVNGDVELDKLEIGVEYKDARNSERYGGGNSKRDRGNMWYIPYETTSESKKHPAAFPVNLPKMSVKLCGLGETGLVLDPFCGSGSTLVAAKELGYDYLGFEIDSEYIKLCEDRLSQENLVSF